MEKETSTIELRFNAAVNVIRGLPKNGSYQPSNDMLLRFYSYFKQATLGPCNQRKPPFWDVVSRAKYDAYKSLGKMPCERAMELYVEELKKIIETMSYTDNVAEFMGSISELNGIDVDDLQTIAPEAIKKVRSHPNSPFASREASPIRGPILNGNGLINGNGVHSTLNDSNENGALSNGHSTADYSDDEYIDTVDDDVVSEPVQHYSRATNRLQNGIPYSRTQTSSAYGLSESNIAVSNDSNTLVFQQILRTIQTMSVDIQQIQNRIGVVEQSLIEVKNHQLRHKLNELKYPKWWPFSQISPTWFIFMIVAPLVAQRFISVMQHRRRK